MEKILGDLCSSTIQWGPGLLLAILMLYGVYRLARGIGIKIVQGLEKPAGALTMQAQSMDRLTGSIQDYVKRDADEHKELIILQRVIRQDLVEIRDLLQEERHGGHEDRKASQN